MGDMDKKRKGKLVFPKEVDRFESVAFVNDPKMTNFKLKLFIRNFWDNIQDLANALQSRRTDVVNVIDKITDGYVWNEKDLDDRYLYGQYKEFKIQFDTLEKTFTIMDEDYKAIIEPFRAVSLKEAKQITKEIRKKNREKS